MEDCNICCEKMKRGHVFKIHKAVNGEYHKCCMECAKKCLLNLEEKATCPYCREELTFKYPNTRGKVKVDTVFESILLLCNLEYATASDFYKSRKIMFDILSMNYDEIKYNHLYKEPIEKMKSASITLQEKLLEIQKRDIPIELRIDLTSLFVSILNFRTLIN